MKDGKYKEGDILGYCGATGLSITPKYGSSFIGESHEEQISDKAVPHLHVELHIGEFKHDTNNNKALADIRIIDPISNFEKWIAKLPQIKNNMIFYKEHGKSTVYIKGADNIYYPIIMGKHFLALFGDWEDNTIKEVDEIKPKSDSYFGLFKSDETIAQAYPIPNIARKVLDTFLLFRVPCGGGMYTKLEKIKDTTSFDENKLTAIYKFVNDQSHITGSGFNPALVPETQKNVKYLLEMIEQVFPEHYQILQEAISPEVTS